MKNNLKYYREKAHLTQSELGLMIGVQAQTIGNIEHSRNRPRYKTMRALASALNVPLEQIFDEGDEKSVA